MLIASFDASDTEVAVTVRLVAVSSEPTVKAPPSLIIVESLVPPETDHVTSFP